MYTVSPLFSVSYVGVLYIFVVWLVCLIVKSFIKKCDEAERKGKERTEERWEDIFSYHVSCHVK